MSLDSVIERSKMYELGMAHMFVMRSIDDFYQTLAVRFNISSTEWLVLSIIAEQTKAGGIRVTDLAGIFRVKTTYITSILNGLRANEYVQNRLDANDARVRLTIVSKKGSKQLEAVERYAQQTMLGQLKGLASAQDFERYTAVLMRLAQLR